MKRVIFIMLFIFPFTVYSKSFDQWKESYIKKASKRGLPKPFLKEVFKKVKLNQKVIDKDRNQVILNKKLNYSPFIKRWLRADNERIRRGKELLKEHDNLLSEIQQKYGVDKEIIVSLWGVETFYGTITGNFKVIDALSSLVYDGRRRKFYETQLNAALRLVYKGHVSYENFLGSWAGATGQCQFMPSNIKVYGQDYDGDGKIDIWNSKEDIFASIANFLKKVGWSKGKSIGSLAVNSKNKKFNLDRYRSQKQYNNLGLRTKEGRHISSVSWKRRKAAKIPLKNSPLVLRGSNYTPILKWNRSSLFAAFNIILMDEFKRSN